MAPSPIVKRIIAEKRREVHRGGSAKGQVILGFLGLIA